MNRPALKLPFCQESGARAPSPADVAMLVSTPASGNRPNRQGFTLLELAVVLGIIVLLTHLAVREIGQWQTSKLHELSDRGLAEIREAVLGRGVERGEDGARIMTGFVADMGRLPCAATNELDRLTLAELWRRPLQNITYDVRAAVASNLVASADSSDADPDVMVPGGWRGPYLRLPFGATRLLDGWGNGYETPDDAHYTARLQGPGATQITQPGEPIAIIRHLGADGAPDHIRTPEKSEDADTTLDLFAPFGADAFTNATLTVTVNGCDSDGFAASGAHLVTARVYSPLNGAIAVSKQTGALTAGTVNLTVSALTPGPRILRIECNGRKSLPRTILIRPGANPATERLRVE